MNENRVRSHDVRVEIRRQAPFEAVMYREIRPEALRLSPQASGTTFEAETGRPLEQFAGGPSNCAVFGRVSRCWNYGMAGFMRRKGVSKRIRAFFGARTFGLARGTPASACARAGRTVAWNPGTAYHRRSERIHTTGIAAQSSCYDHRSGFLAAFCPAARQE